MRQRSLQQVRVSVSLIFLIHGLIIATSAPDRVCRAAFDHSRCVMDTRGLERVERFRINLNEKNFASQKNTLTSSLLFRKDAEPLAPTAAATLRLSMYPTSVLLRNPSGK